MSKSVCVVCGALFVENIGFVEKHYWPCRNNVYGENWIKTVDDNFKRPNGDIDGSGIWNEWIDTKKDIVKYRKTNGIVD